MKLEGSTFTPIMTDLDAVPDSLLKFVQCKFKLSSKNLCSTKVCSCHKNGLKCVTACGDCHGKVCNNSEDLVLDPEEENSSTYTGSIFYQFSYVYVYILVTANSSYPNL